MKTTTATSMAILLVFLSASMAASCVCEIVDVKHALRSEEGEYVIFDVYVTNTGTTEEEFQCRVFDGDVMLKRESMYQSIPSNATKMLRTGGYMPNHTWNLIVKAYRVNIDEYSNVSEREICDTLPFSVHLSPPTQAPNTFSQSWSTPGTYTLTTTAYNYTNGWSYPVEWIVTVMGLPPLIFEWWNSATGDNALKLTVKTDETIYFMAYADQEIDEWRWTSEAGSTP